MLKRVLATLAAVMVAVPLLLWWQADLAPKQLPDAVALATGLAAKLACSGHYLSRFDDTRNASDLASYSPLTRLVRIAYRDGGRVEASMLGAGHAVARHRPGLGCTLEYGVSSPLDKVTARLQREPVDAPWPRGDRAGEPDVVMAEVLAAVLADDNRAGLETRALLVVRDGRVAGEAYAPGIDARTPLLGWSMAKSVTAILLGRLEALGRVNVAENALFPAWSADERAAITLKQMLQMTSGLAFREQYVPGSDATRMLFNSRSASEVAMLSPLAARPGSHFSYSSGTSNLLARLVFDRVGGSPDDFLEFFRRELAVPLGLRATTLEMDDSGVFVGSSFVYAPARDWARLGYLMVNGGEIDGLRLLTEDWIRRATSPNDSDNDRRYGYQFWLNRGGEALRWPGLPVDAYAMRGNRGQAVMMLPSRRAVIVRLGWSGVDYPVDSSFARILAAMDGVTVTP